MSVTTTAKPVSATVLQALTDYDLHHSGAPETPGTPSPPNQQSTVHAETPENWDREHRRVPPYRPIDRSLLGPERPDGVNGIERTFIYLMLNGVGVVAGLDRVWRSTGGKINDRIFRHAVGGEW